MTRAVIKLSSDISTEMPRLSGLIEGCAYNPGAHLLGFRFKKMTVSVEPSRISIYHIEDEKTIQTFMDWFMGMADTDKK